MIDLPNIQRSLYHNPKGGKNGGAPGKDGLEIELQTNSTHILWRYRGFNKWNNLIALRDITGDKGPQGKPGVKGDDGQKGDTGAPGPKGQPGEQGIPGAQGLPGLDGRDGRSVEFRKSATHIQWRFVGDSLWVDLVPLEELKGEKGDRGPEGKQGREGAPGAEGARGPMGFTGPAGPSGGEDTYTFETVSKNIKAWNATLGYTGNQLTTITYTNADQTIIKTFNYTDSKLTSLVLSGDTPSGIELTKTLLYTGDLLTGVNYS